MGKAVFNRLAGTASGAGIAKVHHRTSRHRPTRAFIAGATGVLGRRLVSRLASRGHEVLGLARSDANEGVIRSLGGQPRRADLFDADGLAKAMAGAEVVVHAATSIPTKNRTRLADWATNDRIRREGTRALATAAAAVGARAFLFESVVWLARHADGTPFDEDSPPRPDPILRSALDGETIAREAGTRGGFTSTVLRCGAFYSADSAHTRSMGAALRRGKLPIVGRGDAVWSPLHVDDAAGAFAAAAETPKAGVWHVVDDRPVAVGTLLEAFARKLGAPPPGRVAPALARLAAGKVTADLFTMSYPTSNARFRRGFGWGPLYPSYEEGLDEVVAAWRREGFPA